MSEMELRPEEARSRFLPQWLVAPAWWRPVWAILHDSMDGLIRHDGIMVGSAISYSLIFALFPFAIFLVALGAMFGGSDLSDYISREALAALPEHVIRTLEPELNRVFLVAGRASPLTFGILVTLISITGAVEAIRDGLNRAYGCAEDRNMVRRYASSLFFVLIGMAFILIVAALGIVVPIGMDFLHRYFPEMSFEVSMLEIGRQALLVLVTFAMLLAFHLLLPARRRRWKNVAGGVLLTLFGWWIAGKVFGFYITRIANYSTTYAGLAGIIVLMFFLYIQSLIFLYGAEVNRSIADFRGKSLCRKGS
ncbi:MAG: YihY/virulence factor BrkB family protein [Rhizobiales bacterium]|nr:YihY/virulence factor BrkB family protein [Hyphomicrobiales bacterium]MDQ3560349.1 YihY/virulence factor BrkB family protein [Pseudomonadota bacterium]